MSGKVGEVRIQHEKGEDVMGDKVVVGINIDGQDSKSSIVLIFVYGKEEKDEH